MKLTRLFIFFVVLSCCALTASDAMAQCAMCSLNAENSVQHGNTHGNGLNNGILYLLAAPYIAVAAVGYIWYRKYRRKNIALNIRDEKINLN